MDFQEILNQLQDLPTTFRREGSPYTWIIDALTSGLYLLCQASDAIQTQYNFNFAEESWIDVWGGLAGFVREVDEGNEHFRNRIQSTILASRDSTVAIEQALNRSSFFPISRMEENSVTSGAFYSVIMTPFGDLSQTVSDMQYVRPAGVPFAIYFDFGTFLLPATIVVPASTNNIQSTIPDLLFSDPTLNKL